MYYSPVSLQPKKLVAVFLVAMSLLMAAYGPMVSVSTAQSAIDAKLQEMKQKATTEIDRRIAKYQKTLQSLNVDVSISKGNSSATITSDKGTTTATSTKDGKSVAVNGAKGGSLTATLDSDGFSANVVLPAEIKDKAKQFMQKIVDDLKQLKEKVKTATSLESIKALASNIDAKFKLDQLTNIQATATKAVESVTAVFDKLKTTYTNLQGQVAKLKECVNAVKDGTGSIDVNSSAGSGTSISGTGGCEGYNVTSAEVVAAAQSQMDNLKSVMSTVSSVLSSAITLLGTLMTTFSSLLGGLGNLGNLSSLTGSLGSITGLMSSFSAITSQLGILSPMSGGALSGLSSIASLINI